MFAQTENTTANYEILDLTDEQFSNLVETNKQVEAIYYGLDLIISQRILNNNPIHMTDGQGSIFWNWKVLKVNDELIPIPYATTNYDHMNDEIEVSEEGFLVSAVYWLISLPQIMPIEDHMLNAVNPLFHSNIIPMFKEVKALIERSGGDDAFYELSYELKSQLSSKGFRILD